MTYPAHDLQLVQEVTQELTQFMTQHHLVCHKPAVFLLGKTGAGKSTLIHALKQTPLRLESIQKLGVTHKRVVFADGIASKPDIGLTSNSETRFPQSYACPTKNYYLSDTAGFGDTRGPTEKAVAYLTTRQARKICADVSGLVLVVNATDFESRAVNFTSLLDSTWSLFVGKDRSDAPKLLNNVLLVVTGGSDDMSVSHILDHLKELLLDREKSGDDLPYLPLLSVLCDANRVFSLPAIQAIAPTVPTKIHQALSHLPGFKASTLLPLSADTDANKVIMAVDRIAAHLLDLLKQYQNVTQESSQVDLTLKDMKTTLAEAETRLKQAKESLSKQCQENLTNYFLILAKNKKSAQLESNQLAEAQKKFDDLSTQIEKNTAQWKSMPDQIEARAAYTSSRWVNTFLWFGYTSETYHPAVMQSNSQKINLKSIIDKIKLEQDFTQNQINNIRKKLNATQLSIADLNHKIDQVKKYKDPSLKETKQKLDGLTLETEELFKKLQHHSHRCQQAKKNALQVEEAIYAQADVIDLLMQFKQVSGSEQDLLTTLEKTLAHAKIDRSTRKASSSKTGIFSDPEKSDVAPMSGALKK